MLHEKEKKYQIGDIVKVKGYQENFIVDSWWYEATGDEDGLYEHLSYILKGIGTDRYLDNIEEDDINIELLQPINNSIKPLTKTEVNILLDKYNQYMEVHNFLSQFALEDEYKGKANEILNYLKKTPIVSK